VGAVWLVSITSITEYLYGADDAPFGTGSHDLAFSSIASSRRLTYLLATHCAATNPAGHLSRSAIT
jgi:hypothetical protein